MVPLSSSTQSACLKISVRTKSCVSESWKTRWIMASGCQLNTTPPKSNTMFNDGTQSKLFYIMLITVFVRSGSGADIRSQSKTTGTNDFSGCRILIKFSQYHEIRIRTVKRGSMMKTLLAITIFGMTMSSNAETLAVPPFQIEVEDGWMHSIERGPQAPHLWGDVVSIYHPNGNGILKVQFYSTPYLVSKDRLRNMTNVEFSTPLDWHNWGGNSGYQHDYFDKGSFYRQWWLANDHGVIIIVYNSNTESRDFEIDEINEIVNSITVNTP